MARAACKQKQPNEPTEHVVHFSISGADFTRLARERLLEDNPGSAFRIASCLIGDDGGEADAALGILQGTKKLVGNERKMNLVDEKAAVTQKHREKVEWLYAGRIRINDRWYRPIAQVTSFGIKDLVNDRRIEVRRTENWLQSAVQGFINRQWHYCYPSEIAPLADQPIEDADVIFESCGELPHWMTPPRDAQAAIEQWRAAGRQLEERGHALWYPRYKSGYFADDAVATLDEMAEILGDEDTDYDRFRDDEDRKEVLVDARVDRTREERRIEDELKRQQRERTDAEEAEADARAEAARQARIRVLRTKILDQAGTNLIELSWPEETRTAEEIERGQVRGERRTCDRRPLAIVRVSRARRA